MKCLKCQNEINGPSAYGLHKACFLKEFRLSELHSFSELDPKKGDSAPSAADVRKTTDTFYQGRYRKYSAKLGDSKYILKIGEEKYPDLPEMEYISNKIAQQLGLSVPEYHLIQFTDVVPEKIKKNAKAFVTKNFMQNQSGTLHHIYKFLSKSEDYNCENLMKIIINQTRRPLDVELFIEMCLFDSFIGNNDRHGRNLAIIETSSGKRLAPIYDNPSYFGIEDMMLGAHFNIRGSIECLHTKKPMMIDYLREFKRLGKKQVCLEFKKKVDHSFEKITETIQTSTLLHERKQAFEKYLNKRLEDLKNV